MRDRHLLTLLRRIALGLPMVAGPLVVGAAAPGCTECVLLPPLGSTSHPRSSFTDARVGTPDAFDPAGCDALCHLLDSGEPGDVGVAAGDPVSGFLGRGLGQLTATCRYGNDGAGGEILACSYSETACHSACGPRPIYGRAPSGLVIHRSDARTALARWLADGARLEAASVPAFEDVAAELQAFDAPEGLVAAAHRSAEDERRHARQMGRLAARVGADVEPVRRHETALRGPAQVALDNAVEGCVHEAYAALAAAWQADRAGSAAVRAVYRGIAADEARHALLSFVANDWLSSQLSSRERRRTEDARHQSIAALGAGQEHEPEECLRAVLGLPDATRSMDLVALLT